MLTYKKRGFAGFSKPRKIVALFLFIMVILSIVFSIVSYISGNGLTLWTFFSFVYFFPLFILTYNLGVLKKILRKTYKPLMWIFYSGMILFFMIYASISFWISGYKTAALPENPPDLIVIPGCHITDNAPSNLLKTRLDAALEVLNKYPDIICIVTGGIGYGEIVAESYVMKNYLAGNGISESRIFEEAESTSTFENLFFAKTVIEENNLKYENIIIVTSEYHIPRAVMLARRVYPDSQLYAVKAKSPFPVPFPLFNPSITREFFAFAKSYVFDR